MSKIEWTQDTWNPIVGCSLVSPGCTNCYAMTMAARIDKMTLSSHYEGLTKKVNGNVVWTGKLALANNHIFTKPLRRRIPTTYFVNSMGDLFHEDCPDEWIVSVLDVIRRTSYDGGSNCGTIKGKGEHTYQVLTKRAARMAALMRRLRFESTDDRGLFLSDNSHPPVVMKNLWLGVSAERQEEADERIPLLMQTPAAVRFISAEPLLGPIDLNAINVGGEIPLLRSAVSGAGRRLDWVIVGGESGHEARPMHPAWARALRDQCLAADVSYFFKQWGEWAPSTPDHAAGNPRSGWQTIRAHPCVAKAHELYPEAGAAFIERVGKKAAGRLLDGREHNDYPPVRA